MIAHLFQRPSPEQLVREHAAMVHRLLRRIFGPVADVDDVFQQVFVEALRSLPNFRGRARLSTWLRRITWNVAYQEMRVQYRQPRASVFDETAHPAVGRDPEKEVDARRARARLYAALETLEPRERLAVVLHDVEGQTLKEIAKTLGRPLPTVASQLYAGRAKLIARLSGDRLGGSVAREEVESS